MDDTYESKWAHLFVNIEFDATILDSEDVPN